MIYQALRGNSDNLSIINDFPESGQLKIGRIPPTKHSTAITIRINPISRIITLLPVSPITFTSLVDKRRII